MFHILELNQSDQIIELLNKTTTKRERIRFYLMEAEQGLEHVSLHKIPQALWVRSGGLEFN